MKRTKPSFGHAEMDYRLLAVFKRAAKQFEEADVAHQRSEKEYDRVKDNPDPIESVKIMPQLFSALEGRTEAGVVLLMSATAYLEQIINDYGHTFLDPEAYDEHLDNLRTVSKWLLLPRLCQNKDVRDNDPAINSLRELIKARNAIVHHRRKEMYLDVGKAHRHVATESERFLSASRKAESTVDALLKILTSPPPGLATKPRDSKQSLGPTK
jgi:hypothetical protein